MIALILAAGAGSRLNNIDIKNKCLIKKNNRYLLDYHIDHLLQMEVVSQIYVIVYHNADYVIEAVRKRPQVDNKRLGFIFQKKLNGIIGAIEDAKETIGNEDFLIILGDEYYIKPKFQEAIHAFYQGGYDAVVGYIPRKDVNMIRGNYTFSVKNDMIAYEFVEKPENPINPYMGTGFVVFSNKKLLYILNIRSNPRFNQKILVDFLNYIINEKGQILAYEIADDYINVNTERNLNSLMEM